jgi:epoxyqueuosine reductase QueG
MEKANVLKENVHEWGATKCGFADLKGCLPEKYEKLNYGISIAIRLSDAIIDEIDDKPTHIYFHHYRSVNSLIDNITLRATMLLQEWGYNAIAIPASQTVKTKYESYSGDFQHKTAARKSGLGWIGKNGLLITPEFGPRVRLGTVLTNMKLPIENNIIKRDCGSCSLCKKACPAMAIYGQNWREGSQRSDIIDPQACSEYMNANYKGIGRGSVCGICIRVCPMGSKVNKL